jgi:hypothetical protein
VHRKQSAACKPVRARTHTCAWAHRPSTPSFFRLHHTNTGFKGFFSAHACGCYTETHSGYPHTTAFNLRAETMCVCSFLKKPSTCVQRQCACVAFSKSLQPACRDNVRVCVCACLHRHTVRVCVSARRHTVRVCVSARRHTVRVCVSARRHTVRVQLSQTAFNLRAETMCVCACAACPHTLKKEHVHSRRSPSLVR